MNELVESSLMVQGTTDARMRSAIANAARALSVKGRISDLGGGSIEVIAQGRSDSVDALVKKIRGLPGVETLNVLKTQPIARAGERFLAFQA